MNSPYDAADALDGKLPIGGIHDNDISGESSSHCRFHPDDLRIGIHLKQD